MAEVIFARAFLAKLDAKPIKITADHVEDPRNFPARPAQILPKMPKEMSKSRNAPAIERTVTVAIKSLRNPPVDIKLTSQLLTTSILELKQAVTDKTSIPGDKIKLLFKKKPVSDTKVLKDLLEDEATSIEFSAMVMGGASALAKEPTPTSAAGALTPQFWDDLKVFLTQRLNDEKEAARLHDLFKAAWKE